MARFSRLITGWRKLRIKPSIHLANYDGQLNILFGIFNLSTCTMHCKSTWTVCKFYTLHIFLPSSVVVSMFPFPTLPKYPFVVPFKTLISHSWRHFYGPVLVSFKENSTLLTPLNVPCGRIFTLAPQGATKVIHDLTRTLFSLKNMAYYGRTRYKTSAPACGFLIGQRKWRQTPCLVGNRRMATTCTCSWTLCIHQAIAQPLFKSNEVLLASCWILFAGTNTKQYVDTFQGHEAWQCSPY